MDTRKIALASLLAFAVVAIAGASFVSAQDTGERIRPVWNKELPEDHPLAALTEEQREAFFQEMQELRTSHMEEMQEIMQPYMDEHQAEMEAILEKYGIDTEAFPLEPGMGFGMKGPGMGHGFGKGFHGFAGDCPFNEEA